jgi:hypothetical protein
MKTPITYRNFLKLALYVLFTISVTNFSAVAQQSIEMLSCGDNISATIISSEELTILGIDGKGINVDYLEDKTFDHMTYHIIGVLKIELGNQTGTFYSKYDDASGDFVIMEVFQVGNEREWKYLYGIGKWKGIIGGGRAIPLTRGMYQSCVKITGTYELK